MGAYAPFIAYKISPQEANMKESDFYEFDVLILGGTGQVGMAVARKFASEGFRKIAITGLRKEEVEESLKILRNQYPDTRFEGEYGNIFVRKDSREKSRDEVLEEMVMDALADFTREILEQSFLHDIISRYRPRMIIDTINTATALAYQDIFTSSRNIIEQLNKGEDIRLATLKLISSSSIPLLIRHIQILWESMIENRTKVYIKVGTTGTGGMGLNIPYTHGEERPSRVLLAKSALAGAHTMLLFLASRTPYFSILGNRREKSLGPIIKEIKPAALIAWKGIGYGKIYKKGKPIHIYDEKEPIKLKTGEVFDIERIDRGTTDGSIMEDVFVDTGENGVFTIEEFKAITSLNQMEAVTPEEIANAVFMEAMGDITSFEVLSALGGSLMNPSYRAGYLRYRALKILAEMKEKYDGKSWAFEILGPPRLSKLIMEAELLKEIYGTAENFLKDSTDEVLRKMEEFVYKNDSYRKVALSIGIPIYIHPDKLLFARRNMRDKHWESRWTVDEKHLKFFRNNEWIDISPQNVEKWRNRIEEIRREAQVVDTSSMLDRPMYNWIWENGKLVIDPGEFTAWIFENEDMGYRFKTS